jgi:hypothetical protein
MNPFAPSKYCFPCTAESRSPGGQESLDSHHSPDGDRGMSSASGLVIPGADTLDIDDATIARILTAHEHY